MSLHTNSLNLLQPNLSDLHYFNLLFVFLFDLILYILLRPINNLSVIKGRVFQGWTSTKLGLMFLQKKLSALQYFNLLFCLFVWFDSLRPINNLSVIKGRVFLGWTSTKLGLMFLLKDAKQWGSNPWSLGHCTPILNHFQTKWKAETVKLGLSNVKI